MNYRIRNRATGLLLKGRWRTPDEAVGEVQSRCQHWTNRGFPTSEDEFEVVEIAPEPQRESHFATTTTYAVPPRDTITVPFPLGVDRLAYLILPNDLTTAEAERMKKGLTALAIDGS